MTLEVSLSILVCGESSWGEMSLGRVVLGRVVFGASCPVSGDEMSRRARYKTQQCGAAIYNISENAAHFEKE